MRRKKSIPVPEPEKQELEYVCPSASWGDMTGLIPAGECDDKVDEAYKELFPYRPEYLGEANKTKKQP
ncbi:hypothetical protein SAMN02910353_02649 [Ruminococcus sp. YRD2003]|uniref:hypothetical protein n=1 Tax=Ruminococcus sp. YRD2003 TaxID=1452313 RepID=UPI0008AC9AA1|nr:hypothetical protein SAMN02910353_02649 [Ruminococcus flavefaciens]